MLLVFELWMRWRWFEGEPVEVGLVRSWSPFFLVDVELVRSYAVE
jgi:hypothetical protein